MELTNDLILYELKSFHPAMIQKESRNFRFSGIQVYREGMVCSGRCLYLIRDREYADLPDEIKAACSFLISGSVNLNGDNRIPLNVICIDKKQADFVEILNRVLQLNDFVNEFSKEMAAAVCRREPVNAVLQILVKLLKMPMILFDTDFSVMGSAFPETAASESLSPSIRHTIEQGYTDYSVMDKVDRRHMMQRVKVPQTVYLTSNIDDPEKADIDFKIGDEKRIWCYGLILTDWPFREGGKAEQHDDTLINIVLHQLLLYFQWNNQEQIYDIFSPDEKYLLHILNEDLTEEEIRNRLPVIGKMPFYSTYITAVFQQGEECFFPPDFIAKGCRNLLRGAKVLIYKGSIVILRDFGKKDSDGQFMTAEEAESFQNQMSHYHYKMGISMVFSRLSDFPDSVRQAQRALELSDLTDEKYSCYEDLFPYDCLLTMEEKHPLQMLQSFRYRKLKRFDRENHVEYTSIALAYIRCNCNAIQTSRVLYCHRNTVTNALKKIAGMQIDLTDYRTQQELIIADYIEQLKGRQQTEEK